LRYRLKYAKKSGLIIHLNSENVINSSSTHLNTARKAAQAGAEIIKNNYGVPQDIRVKSDSKTLVTETDLAAEAAILDVLKRTSQYRILSEESGLTGEREGPVWIVDPLDGTSNFARSLPLFAVSVALVDGDSILTGVIIDPVHHMEYYALKGGGAFCNGTKIPHCNKLNSVPALFLNHGSHPDDKMKYAEITRRLSVNFNLRKLGTTALELCFVAAGLFDGFICSGDEIWDFAAGALIASEAGYRFSDWKGQKWDGKCNYILIARPEFHARLTAEIAHLQQT
jgi:myo-inositol-1(or 4)-monophosphatase